MLAALLTATVLAAVFTAVGNATAPGAEAHGSLGTLPVGNGPSGIGVNADGTLAMVANTDDGTVTVLDIGEQISVVDTIAVGGEPTGVTFTPDGTEAWVSTWTGNNVKVIDVATLAVIDTVSAGNGSLSVVFSNDGETAWVINYNGNSVGVVDTDTRALLRTITGPSGFALPQRGIVSSDGATLTIAGSAGGYYRIDTSDDSVETTSISGFFLQIAATPDESEHWVLDNGGFVKIIDPQTGALLDTVTTGGATNAITLGWDETQMLISTVLGTEIYDIETRSLRGTMAPVDELGGIAVIPGQNRALRALDSQDAVAVLGFEQERLAGADRFRTAVEVSKRAFPTPAVPGPDPLAPVVFVANGLDFPDALAAGPAAGKLGGSLLLTNPTSLPTVVRDEIVRLDPSTIYIVGGTGAVSASVEAALTLIQPNVIRLAGASRYQTGAAIVEEAWDGLTVPEVFIATGRNYPDALSAGAVAAGEGIPVILVDGNLASVPASTLALITELAPAQITIAGGTGVVSAGIMSQLTTTFGSAEVRRLAGANRYATSTAINLDAYPTNGGVIFATGGGFADALAGATLAGRAQVPLYLVEKTCVTAGGINAIYDGQATNLFLLGGTGSLSTAVEALTPCS